MHIAFYGLGIILLFVAGGLGPVGNNAAPGIAMAGGICLAAGLWRGFGESQKPAGRYQMHQDSDGRLHVLNSRNGRLWVQGADGADWQEQKVPWPK